jgi:oligoribonuclease
MSEVKNERLIWLDLEMTGLNTVTDSILEIATVVTDFELNELAEGPVCAIYHDERVLKAMDHWNRSHHTDTGLWQRVINSKDTLRSAETKTLEFLKPWVNPGTSPMCGNSICQDRRFMARLMPELEAWFHYRHLDVSTIKVLATHWMPAIKCRYKKENRHEALSDIRESIGELRYYRQFMGEFGGQDKTERS